MTATLNINLGQCDTTHLCAANGGDHVSICAAAPVNIHCHIPRSVTFTVTCQCWNLRSLAEDGAKHAPDCGGPARPIRVTYSISGETWEESAVADVGFASPYAQERMSQGTIDSYEQICRSRWALVKALVTGGDWDGSRATLPLFRQRDAVFSAIAAMVRMEDASIAIKQRLRKACPEVFPKAGVTIPGPERRESAAFLAAYVTRLIEQVGAMP